MSCLLVTSGPLFGAYIPIPEEAYIGRLALCSVQLPSSQISRKHARLYQRDRYYFVEDLGSRNGTFVNGNRVERTTRLAVGDVITVGDVSMVFHSKRRLLSAKYGEAWVLFADADLPEPLHEAPLGRFEGDGADLVGLADLLAATIEEEGLVRGILQLLADRLALDEVVLLRRAREAALPKPLGVVAASGPVPIHRGLYERVLQSGRGLAAASLPRVILHGHAIGEDEVSGHALYFPLKLEGRVMGVLCCTRLKDGEPFKAEEMARVGALAAFFIPALENARRHGLQRRRHRARIEPQKSEGLLMGHTPSTHRLMAAVKEASTIDGPLLLVGERGMGKERLARLIHGWSERWQGPMITVSCHTLSESQLELLLFGRVGQGRESAEGKLERPVIGKAVLADGGTLFLDRVETLPEAVQDRLLRLLQSGHVWRLGAAKSLWVDIRLIASTESPLYTEQNSPILRPELAHLLNQNAIEIIPLRERRADIENVVDELLARVCVRLGKVIRQVSKKAYAHLGEQPWPGNIRELEDVLTRAVSFSSGGELTVDDVELALSAGAFRLSDSLRDSERKLCEQALKLAKGRPREAAQLLEMSPEAFERQLRDLGLAPHKDRS